MRLGGSQCRSGRYQEVNILDPAGTRTSTPRSSSPKQVAILIKLPGPFINKVRQKIRRKKKVKGKKQKREQKKKQEKKEVIAIGRIKERAEGYLKEK
jgi:hypothetical protein